MNEPTHASIVSRKESMSPDGYLQLHVQEDGDVILTISRYKIDGHFDSSASVEFCTPVTGGGRSPRTYAALVNLARAIALDNQENPSRSGEFIGSGVLERFPNPYPTEQ